MKCYPCPALVLVALCALLPAGCATAKPTSVATGVPVVRVRLLSGIDRITFTAKTPPLVRVGEQGEVKKLGLPKSVPTIVVLASDGWRVGSAKLGAGVLFVEPDGDGTLAINGLPYRGRYRLVASTNAGGPGSFDVINDVDAESYLMGVIPKELLSDWHVEAYKAQAVVARTYALWEIYSGSSKKGAFDLYPDERSQVYGGMSAETNKSIAAVEATRGQVVVYGPPGKERIFCTYFSSCCGGVSNSVADVFNEPNIPPLKAKSVDGLCDASPRFNWGPVTLNKVDFTRRVRAWGTRQGRPEAKIGTIAAFQIAAVNDFDRPRSFLLTDEKGVQYSLNAEDARRAINTEPQGGQTVYSSFFRPVDAGADIQLIEGHGWGHGVGMCQWCTQVRATQGMPYTGIVLAAFPQAKLMAAY